MDFVTAKAVDITDDGLIGHLLEKSAKIVFTEAGVRTERVKGNRLFVFRDNGFKSDTLRGQ